jgi:hypothetical protein
MRMYMLGSRPPGSEQDRLGALKALVSMIECPGVFTMPFVPDGWTATLDGNLYELQPPTRDAALHISVYRRSPPAEAQPGQAEAFLKRFVHGRPPDGDAKFIVLPQNGHEQRAFAKYRNRGDDGTISEWFAACIVWPSAMLMCSCNAAPGHSALTEGEVMIASIFEGTEADS